MNNPNLATWECHTDTCPFEIRSANCKPAGCFGETIDRRDLTAHARSQEAKK